MSALEKIRKRPALVIGVIGVALFLFIITGLGTSFMELFKDNTTVAKVDGEKINIQEFNQRSQNRQNETSESRTQTLQSMVDEALRNKAIKKLGITVTKEEMQELLFGEHPSPTALSFANQLGFTTAQYANPVAQFYNVANEKGAAPEIKNYWEMMENAVREDFLIQKYVSLLGALTVNDVDAQMYANDKKAYNVSIINLPLNNYSDADINVSDDEIENLYNNRKELYKVDMPTRIATYIKVPITASQADVIELKASADSVMETLLTSDDISKVNKKFDYNTAKGTRQNLNLTDDQYNLLVEQRVAYLYNEPNSGYVIAKLNSVENAPVNANVDLVVIEEGDAAAIVEQLNNGTEPEGLKVNITPGIPLNLISFNDVTEITENEGGNYFIPAKDSELNFFISQNMPGVEYALKINSIESDEVLDIAAFSRQLTPSKQTVADLKESFENYLSENASASAFSEGNMGVKETVIVDESMLHVPGIDDSSALASWVMNTPVGEVSEIYKDKNGEYFYAIAINEAFDDYIPVTFAAINNSLKAEITKEKKAAKIAADYTNKANDIDGIAELLGIIPATRSIIPTDNDPILAANVTTAQPGAFVGPVAGRDGVYFFVVNNVEDNSARTNELRSALKTNLQNDVVSKNGKALRHDKKITYKAQRFFQAQDK